MSLLNPSNLLSYLTETGCAETDTLCRATDYVGLPTLHTPEFIQNALGTVRDTTGIPSSVTTVVAPIAVVGGAYAVYKNIKGLEDLVSEAVYNEIKDNKALVKVVKGMSKDALSVLNQFPAELARHLNNSSNIKSLSDSKNQAAVLRAYAEKKSIALLVSPAQTKAQADAAKAPAKSYVPAFAKAAADYAMSTKAAVAVATWWNKPKAK